MNQQVQESLVLDNAVAELQAEGFDVYPQPAKPLVPAFLGGIRPDAIAIRDDKNLIVEIVRDEPEAKRTLEALRSLVSKQTDWELKVYWISHSTTPPRVERVSHETIENTISSITVLVDENRLAPAFLLAWATFEALGRSIMPHRFARPQTPGRLIEVLASEGYLTPTEADNLRTLAEVRNQLVHGGLQTKPRKSDLKRIVDVLRKLESQPEAA